MIGFLQSRATNRMSQRRSSRSFDHTYGEEFPGCAEADDRVRSRADLTDTYCWRDICERSNETPLLARLPIVPQCQQQKEADFAAIVSK